MDPCHSVFGKYIFFLIKPVLIMLISSEMLKRKTYFIPKILQVKSYGVLFAEMMRLYPDSIQVGSIIQIFATVFLSR